MNKKNLRFNDSIEYRVSIFKYNDSLYNFPGYEKFIPLINKIASYELTKKQQMCFNLYYYEEMSMREIAQKLNLSISTVSRHINRSIEKIRKILVYYIK